MITLGVTGGIGTGKTTVCRLLEGHGARVFYADREARRLSDTDAAVRAETTALLGEGAYPGDGPMDRRFVAARVFGDAAKLAALNAIVHPRVFRAFEKARDAARAAGVWLFVKEAALIFETGGEKWLDAVAAVEAPLETRIARVVARDGTTPPAVRARIAHQMAPADLRRRAQFVLVNSGDAAALKAQVDAMVDALRELEVGD